MDNSIELLAPAGSWDSFTAAVENGADAIYMGGQLFNARQNAANFDGKELERAVDYAHVRGVKIYLTMNTLLDDNEIEQALEYLIHPYEWGIDGLIVQDLGLAAAVNRYFQGLDLHASTQMTTYNLEGVNTLKKLGFKRVVLARELSLSEIQDISRKAGIEIEIFVHGALCVSYSGQCLMSSMIGGRSGNRGKCAQPCRQKYGLVTMEDGEARMSQKYILSPRDLCSIDFLDKITAAGVKSLKIEGRMKSPEYVAIVVSTYRKYLDRALEKTGEGNYHIETADSTRLAQIFNRGGFSKGYFFGKTGKDMMCYEKPKNWGIYLGEALSYQPGSKLLKLMLSSDIGMGDGVEVWNKEAESPGNIITEIRINSKKADHALKGQIVEIGSLSGKIKKGDKVYKTSDKKLNETARESFSGRSIRKAPLVGAITIEEGERAVFVVADKEGNKVSAKSGMAAETALVKPLQEDRVMEQLSKTGATPFYFQNIDIKLKGNPAMSVSELNNLRREALDKMERERILPFKRKMSQAGPENFANPASGPDTVKQKTTGCKTSVYLHRVDESCSYSGIKAGRVNIPLRYMFGKYESEKLIYTFKEKGAEIFVWLPGVTRGNYDKLIKQKLADIVKMDIDGFTIGNHGTLEIVKESQLKLAGNYSLNAYNSMTLDALYRLGFDSAALSPELNLKQITRLRALSPINLEAVVYGRIIVMTSEYCPSGSVCGGFSTEEKCKGCLSEPLGLKDKMNAVFPVVTDKIDCRSSIYNSNVLLVPEMCGSLKKAGISLFRLDFLYEHPDEINSLVSLYNDILKFGEAASRDYSQLISDIKAKGFTKGHYSRGV